MAAGPPASDGHRRLYVEDVSLKLGGAPSSISDHARHWQQSAETEQIAGPGAFIRTNLNGTFHLLQSARFLTFPPHQH